MEYRINIGGKGHKVVIPEGVEVTKGNCVELQLDKHTQNVTLSDIKSSGDISRVLYKGKAHFVQLERNEHGMPIKVYISGTPYEVEVRRIQDTKMPKTSAKSKVKFEPRVLAILPGRVNKLLVAPGDTVTKGQPLVVLEAMKMENEIMSLSCGRVRTVNALEGSLVSKGDVLVELEEVT